MEIPYYIFPLVYAVVLIFYAVFVFFSIYHMIRFGFFDFVAKAHTAMLMGVIFVIFVFTVILLRNVPWTETFPLFNQLPFGQFDI